MLEDSLHLLHGRWVAVTAAFRGAQGDELEMYYDAVLKKWVDPSDPDSMKPDEPLGLPPATAAASPAPAAAAAAARCCWGGGRRNQRDDVSVEYICRQGGPSLWCRTSKGERDTALPCPSFRSYPRTDT